MMLKQLMLQSLITMVINLITVALPRTLFSYTCA